MPTSQEGLARLVRLAFCLVALALAVGALGGSGAVVARAASAWGAASSGERLHGGPPDAELAPEQLASFVGVDLAGARCGRGAPYRYYVDASANPSAGILFLLNGGGACLKEGTPPQGVTDTAAQLFCMAYDHFTDPLMSDTLVQVLPGMVRYLRRSDVGNPFRDHTYVFVPYCTGDLHAGSATRPYDYDPDPDATFEVTHRGHLNLLAVLDDVARTYPAETPVVLTGVSAGGVGAILNFPDVVARWPETSLLADSGILPSHPNTLVAREGARIAERWGVGALLPSYCDTDDCLSDTLRLLAAHAAWHDGRKAPWRPFGFLQGQQDAVLSAYLEVTACEYQLGLARGMASGLPDNLRAYVPATDDHVFASTPGSKTPVGGIDMLEWFWQVAGATSASELPADAIDPWLACNPVSLPMLELSR